MHCQMLTSEEREMIASVSNGLVKHLKSLEDDKQVSCRLLLTAVFERWRSAFRFLATGQCWNVDKEEVNAWSTCMKEIFLCVHSHTVARLFVLQIVSEFADVPHSVEGLKHFLSDAVKNTHWEEVQQICKAAAIVERRDFMQSPLSDVDYSNFSDLFMDSDGHINLSYATLYVAWEEFGLSPRDEECVETFVAEWSHARRMLANPAHCDFS